jgi:hypothetical protein
MQGILIGKVRFFRGGGSALGGNISGNKAFFCFPTLTKGGGGAIMKAIYEAFFRRRIV